MNKVTRSKDLMVPKVTTGPISASTKVYSAAEGFPDVRVPFREIALSEGAGEKSFRVYDPSGPYTDAHASIDVEKGLPRVRAQWVRERGGVEEYVGRDIRPEDNGNVSGKHLARDFPNKPAPLRAIGFASGVPSPLVGEGQGGGDCRTSAVGIPPTPSPSPRRVEDAPPARWGGGQVGVCIAQGIPDQPFIRLMSSTAMEPRLR
jgi:ThiC-associated domain